MPKTCNYEGCRWPRFAAGYCRSHQRFRTDKTKKVSGSPLQTGNVRGHERQKVTGRYASKSVPQRRSSVLRSPVSRKRSKKKPNLSGQDHAFYLGIWDERPHFCFACGNFLGDVPLTLFFDHILEKGLERYKHLRHIKENICLLCWDCHTSKDKIKKLIKLKQDTIKKLIP